MAGRKKTAGPVHVGWPKPNFQYTVKTHVNFKTNYYAALMYAHYELSSLDLKKEVVKYLKAQDPKDPVLEKIKDIPENRFTTLGKYMYILNHGGDVPDEISSNLARHLEKVIDEEEAKSARAKKEAEYLAKEKDGTASTDEVPKLVITIQDRLREKAREASGEVEGWIDDFFMDRKSSVKTVEDFVNLFKSFDLKGPHMRYIQASFENRGAEITEVLTSKNKDLSEGYSNYSKPELKKMELFYTNLFKACAMMQEAAKVVRAPRKKKPVSQDKLVAKLKYKKDDSSLGIVSINPVQIIGAKEVWVYNTKTRKFAQYKCLDERGLSVKGASLENYSQDSLEKTLRKPAETLAEFKKASKVKLRTFLKDLSTVDTQANGKLNEHHIILRVDK